MLLSAVNVVGQDGTWTNLAEIGSCKPQHHHYPTTQEQVVDIVRHVRSSKSTCRVAGCGRSPNTSTFTEGHMIHMDCMCKILAIDTRALSISCEGGVLMEDMMKALDKEGLMLKCVPSYVKTTVAGCLATATHSSGMHTNSLCDYVLAMTIVDGVGNVCVLDGGSEAKLAKMRLAACHLGALGVVVRVELQVEKKSAWHMLSQPVSLADAMNTTLLATKVAKSEYYRFWWVPHTKMCYESVGTRVDLESPTPVVAKQHLQWATKSQSLWARVTDFVKGSWLRHSVVQHALHMACWFPTIQPYINQLYAKTFYGAPEEQYGSALECFTFDCLFKQWANEWAIDASKAVEVLSRLQCMIINEKMMVHFPVEFRFSGADQAAMSPSFGRPTCWIGIVMYRPFLAEARDTRRYYDGFCNIMTTLGGRPHWAKYYDWDCKQLEMSYGENWKKFMALRSEMDPDDLFVNGWLKTLLSNGRHNSTEPVP